MQVLECARRQTPGEVVTREQLVARVWPGVFVSRRRAAPRHPGAAASVRRRDGEPRLRRDDSQAGLPPDRPHLQRSPILRSAPTDAPGALKRTSRRAMPSASASGCRDRPDQQERRAATHTPRGAGVRLSSPARSAPPSDALASRPEPAPRRPVIVCGALRRAHLGSQPNRRPIPQSVAGRQRASPSAIAAAPGETWPVPTSIYHRRARPHAVPE